MKTLCATVAVMHTSRLLCYAFTQCRGTASVGIRGTYPSVLHCYANIVICSNRDVRKLYTVLLRRSAAAQRMNCQRVASERRPVPAHGHRMRRMEAVWTVGKIQNHTICSVCV